MVETEDLAASDPSTIRHSIDETRASLSSKLDALEHEVKETASEAKSSVEHKVEEVKKAVNLRYQVSQHPWPFVAGAIVLGVIAGGMLRKRRSNSSAAEWQPAWQGNGGTSVKNVISNGDSASKGPRTQLHDTMDAVKGVALGVLLSTLRKVAKEALPESLAPQVNEMFDGVGRSVGTEAGHQNSSRERQAH